MSLAKRFSGWVALRNGAAPAAVPGEVQLYAEGGLAKVRQPDGTIITIANSTEIESVIFDGGAPDTDHSLGDTIIFDAGGVV